MTTIAIAIVGRAITLDRELSKKKPRTDTKKDAKRITFQGAIEKSSFWTPCMCQYVWGVQMRIGLKNVPWVK